MNSRSNIKILRINVFYVLVICFILSACKVASVQHQAKLTESEKTFVSRIDSITQIVKDSIGIFDGLAVAVVKDNKVLMTRGVGVLDSETKVPVTDESMFYIASATKSFVGLLAAILHEKKMFSLNTTLQEAFPNVKFNDSIPAGKVLMSHLLSHSSTVNNGPLTYRLSYTGQINDSIQLSLVKYSVPNGKELGEYLYDNTGYNLYTIALKETTGIDWKEALKKYVFEPLGMKSTSAYISDIENYGLGFAKPSASLVKEDVNAVIPMNYVKTDATMHSAGGLITNARDMSKWLLAQVNHGKINRKQVIDSSTLELSRRNFSEKKASNFYTLGWNKVVSSDSTVLFYHYGGYPGYSTVMIIYPKANLGLALMSTGLNSEFSVSCIQKYMLGYFRNPDKVDKNFNTDIIEAKKNKNIIHTNFMNDINNRKKRQWMIDFSKDHNGIYSHESYGSILIQQGKNEIKVMYGNMEAVATPYTIDHSIRVELIPYKGEAIVFRSNNKGDIIGLTYRDRYYQKQQR